MKIKSLKITILGILFFSIGLMTSCLKKGENDPLISLRSRNNRLIGEWKLASMEYETYSFTKKTNGEEYTQKTSSNFDGTSLKVVDENFGISSTSFSTIENIIYDYSHTLEIKKDGTSVCTTIKTEISPNAKPASIITSSSYWNWEDTKKRKIYLETGCEEGTVIRLTNKELILEYENSFVQNNNNFYYDLENKGYSKKRLKYTKK